MKRFTIATALLASACGPGMQHHDTTPSSAVQSGKNDDMVCNDDVVDARQAAQPRCRRKTDVDADKRSTQDAVDRLQSSTRSR